MKIKHKTFSGGYRFKHFEGQPEPRVIELGIPEKIIIPLKQGFGREVPPLIKPGDRVKTGQIIGRDDNSVSSPIHSSVQGIVEEIRTLDYLKGKVKAAIIKADTSHTPTYYNLLKDHYIDWKSLTPEKIEELLYISGVTSLNRGGIPTRYKSSIISLEEVRDVIIHGIGSDVYSLSLFLLIKEKGISNFAEGIEILKKIMPGARFHLAFDKYHNDLIEEMSKLLVDHKGIELYALDPKYPQGFDEILISTVLEEHFPYGDLAANVGVVVLNIQNVLQVYQAAVMGKPLVERIVALCGPGFKENLHVRVKVGTPLEYIINGRTVEDKNLRFILNSPINGPVLSDLSLPVDHTFSHIVSIPETKMGEFLAFARPGLRKDSHSRTFLSSIAGSKKGIDTNLHGEKRPCISCNFCEEVCPVGIIPHLIYRYVEKGIIDETIINYKIFSCVDCNLCSYVCPSKIQVAKYMKEGKERLIHQGCDFSSCKLPYVDFKGIDEYRGIK